MSNTRSSSVIWGLGPMITEDDKVISGRKLPSKRQVLRCFMAHYGENKSNSTKAENSAAKQTLEKIQVHFRAADIPMMPPKSCFRLVKKLYQFYVKNIKSIAVSRREKSFAIQRVDEFQADLDTTLCLWPNDVREIIRNISHPERVKSRNVDEDLRFFESMLTDRTATYGGKDEVTRSLTKRKDERKRKLDSYLQRQRAELNQEKSVRTAEDDDAEPMSDDGEDYCPPEDSPATSKKRILHPKYKADFHKDPRLVEVTTRLKISPTATSALLQTFLQVRYHDINFLYEVNRLIMCS